MSDDGILDAVARQSFPEDEEKAIAFKNIFRAAIIPIFFIFMFFAYYFVFIDHDWEVMSVVARIIVLALVIICTLLLSYEPLEWRLLSASAVTVMISIDTAAQIIGWYENPTMLGGTIEYDFLGHIFTGILTVALLTNIMKNAAGNIHWITVISISIALIWELTEYGISLIWDSIIKRDIASFSFDAENAVLDVIAHLIGMGIAIGFFVAYKWYRCPPEFRKGIMCKV